MSNEPTAEERAIYIGERLGIERGVMDNDVIDSTRSCLNMWFAKWLSSPDGTEEVERAMIERGYHVIVTYCNGEWMCDFSLNSGCGNVMTVGSTKSEAILSAAYKALKAEEGKHG